MRTSKIDHLTKSLNLRKEELLLGRLDKMIQTIQRSTRAHRGVINKAAVVAIADTFFKRYPENKLGIFNLKLVLRLDIYSFVWDLH